MKHLCLIIAVSGLLSCFPGSKIYKSEILHHREEARHEIEAYAANSFNGKEVAEKISYYAPNSNYRCECSFVLIESKKMIEMPTYSGINKPFITYGKTLCKLGDTEIILTLYKSLRSLPGYADLLFLPFKDTTNGLSTYGGGRYLDIKEHDIHMDKVIIDFNKAYNPWCAYSDGFNCPIPPIENHLDLAIKAGEKKYKGIIK